MWVFVTTTWSVLQLRMEETVSKYGGQLGIYRISSFGQPTRGGSPAWELGYVLKTPHRKNPSCYEMLHRASELAAF